MKNYLIYAVLGIICIYILSNPIIVPVDASTQQELAIVDIRISPEEPNEDEDVYFFATITNLRKEPIEFTANCSVDGEPLLIQGSYRIPGYHVMEIPCPQPWNATLGSPTVRWVIKWNDNPPYIMGRPFDVVEKRYSVHIFVTGLPSHIFALVKDGDQPLGGVTVGKDKKFSFANGPSHTLSVPVIIRDFRVENKRYNCSKNTTPPFSSEDSYTFEYKAEYMPTIDSNYSFKSVENTLEKLRKKWYKEGQIINLHLEETEFLPLDENNTQYVAQYWRYNGGIAYLDDVQIKMDPTKKIKLILERQYRLDITSNYGKPIISQYGELKDQEWFKEGTPVSFVIEKRIPYNDKWKCFRDHKFVNWSVTFQNSTVPEFYYSANSSITMKGPAKVEAKWQDDYGRTWAFFGFLAGVFILLASKLKEIGKWTFKAR